MTSTATSLFELRHPRAFCAVAVAVLLLGACGSGEGEPAADPVVAPAEPAGPNDGGAAEMPGDPGREAGVEPGDLEIEVAAPPGSQDPAATGGQAAGNGHVAVDAAPAAVPATAPSPPSRPSPVADAPPPAPRGEPALTVEEAIERASRPPVGPEAGSLVACGDVAEAYRRLMEENRSCSSDADCHVVEGSCAIGLGGCWYAVETSVSYDDADLLAARYRELACGGPVCRCAAPPERATCQEGVCSARS